VAFPSGHSTVFAIVDNAAALAWVANLGCIELHTWHSRVPEIEKPDYLLIDLDPTFDGQWEYVRQIALVVREVMEELGLAAYPKTSGATGLHILLPLAARYTYEETRTFANLLATLAVEAQPAISTIARMIRMRDGKVYVDYGQNGHGQTIVAPFSVRPLPGAPVSCPLRWPEVTARLDPKRFTIRTVRARLEADGDPLAPVLGAGIDIAAALARVNETP